MRVTARSLHYGVRGALVNASSAVDTFVLVDDGYVVADNRSLGAGIHACAACYALCFYYFRHGLNTLAW